ncbi:MAG: TetR/AcrR family transcriptional regulator [Nostoc sp.]|uniref:TetR/AcrR family transcriptional regulator n=1 Tax=Nostoc sp. TaxID=1180 RepID=UPI002FF9E572
MTQSLADTPKRRRTLQGQQTRQAVLRIAVDIASVEGLEGLSLGRLASELGKSKSGLFAHFGSMEDLQLATVDAAYVIFQNEVIDIALNGKSGLAAIWSLCNTWFSYIERKVFRGGCFFAGASAEFDSRPGLIRDKIAEIMNNWLSLLTNLIRESQKMGEIEPNVDANQLAFEINALGLGANWAFQLFDEPKAIDWAKTAILHRLQSVVTSNSLPLLS